MTRLLEDRVAVVYGVGGAIGGAVARTFAREGARVFLAGRTQGHLDAVARDIAAAGGRAETARLDVHVERAGAARAAAVSAAAGGIDVVLDAVSVPHDQGTLLGDLSFEEFWRPVEGFLRGLFLTSRAVAPYLARDRPGVLLTLSEPGARLVVPGILGHGVSAAGKETLTRLLAAELAPAGVRVVGLRPHAVVDGPAPARTRASCSRPPRPRPGRPSRSCSTTAPSPRGRCGDGSRPSRRWPTPPPSSRPTAPRR